MSAHAALRCAARRRVAVLLDMAWCSAATAILRCQRLLAAPRSRIGETVERRSARCRWLRLARPRHGAEHPTPRRLRRTRSATPPRPASAAKERKCATNVARKFLATHGRVSSRFAEAQAEMTARQLADAEARRREVRGRGAEEERCSGEGRSRKSRQGGAGQGEIATGMRRVHASSCLARPQVDDKIAELRATAAAAVAAPAPMK